MDLPVGVDEVMLGSEEEQRLYAVCLFQRASVVPEPYEGIFHDFFGILLRLGVFQAKGKESAGI